MPQITVFTTKCVMDNLNITFCIIYLYFPLGVFFGIIRLLNLLCNLGSTNVYLFDITFTS